jgi:hypothetical protein
MLVENPVDNFRVDKAAQLKHAKALLREAPDDVRKGVGAVLAWLDDAFEQLYRVKANMISAAISERTELKRADNGPALCSNCLRLMTETDEQLTDYIELVVREARNLSWPEDVCRSKLRNALHPGDRIAELGYGRMRVIRPDGFSFWVFQRES